MNPTDSVDIKDMAYIISVSQYDEVKGYRVGIAVRGEPGYYLTDMYWGKDYEKAQNIADIRNTEIHGSLREAWKLIATTMRL